MKKLTLHQIASRKSGKERHCPKCEFSRNGMTCIYWRICDAAFVRGFMKGYKHHREINKLK